MEHPRIRAFITDGPRGGEMVMIDAAEDGSPPQDFELVDPAEPPMRIEESATPIHSTPDRSTYRLRDHDEGRDAYVYAYVRPGE